MEMCIPGETIAIAVEGCCHGHLDDIYARLLAQSTPIDLLICCGDFQSLRTTADYHSFAVPPKYHALGSFYQYYTGEKVAPFLTIFVGGNHEASQPLSELYYGGYVAPNIYYLGAAGVVQYRGVRIGGVSGIFKSYDHLQTRYELPPYDRSTMRSIYHYRNVEIYRLQCLAAASSSSSSQRRLDVMISHDWPQGIEQYGDVQGLLRRKPFFQQEVQDNTLGSPPLMQVLQTVRPIYWFAAHLHVKFTALVNHGRGDKQAQQHKTTAAVASDPTSLVPAQTITTVTSTKIQEPPPPPTQFLAPESSTRCSTTGPDLTDLMTQFLSLDKCLPRRHYLSIVHIPTTAQPKDTAEDETSSSTPAMLQYDPEWLAILKRTHELSRSTRKQHARIPDAVQGVTEAELADIYARFDNGDLTIPMTTDLLAPTVPVETTARCRPLPRMGHPQTDALLQKLDLPHLPNLTIPYVPLSTTTYSSSTMDRCTIIATTRAGNDEDDVHDAPPVADVNEICLDDEEGSGNDADDQEDGKEVTTAPKTTTGIIAGAPVDNDNDEIPLEEERSGEGTAPDASTTTTYREPKKPKMEDSVS
jgi:lariat debranching enzyme